jgi:hypothetical protein
VIIADTGFWIALANKKDKHYRQAHQFAQSSMERLITTDPVITEVCHILLKRQGIEAQLKFVKMYQLGAFDVFTISENQKQRIFNLMHQYSNLPMDFADASLVLLAEHLGHGKILSTDQRDFHAYRWNNNQSFSNLLCL